MVQPTSVAAPPSEPAPSGGSDKGSSSESSTSGAGSGISGKGEITYYQVGLGACGYDDTGDDQTKNIVAMPEGMWDATSSLTNSGINQPEHPWCDKTITVHANGKSIECVIRDRCPGCAAGSIDVTEHAFLALFGSLDAGREQVEWTMN